MGTPLSREELIKKIEAKENVSKVDTSSIDNMKELFDGNDTFNQPLNDWDVSNVTDMKGVFNGATSFNQPLNNWNVSKVENMEWMFKGAKNYTYSFKTWELNSSCRTDDFFRRLSSMASFQHR